MNELLKINYENSDRPTVSGRGLHAALGVQTPYRLWFPRMCEYGFVEGADYTPYFFVHPQNNQETEDHQLTIDMAKEIAMLQRTEKGKEVREYFICVEKQFNSPEAVMARALIIANRQLEIKDRLIAEMEPKAAFYDVVAEAKNAISMREAAKVIGIQGLGQNKLFQFLRDRKLLMSNNQPYQEYVNRGYFRTIEQSYTKSDGSVIVTIKTLVTQRGLDYITKLLED